jgi:hypothetical protein
VSYCIELPASGVLAILCQASFSGRLAVNFTVILLHVLFFSGCSSIGFRVLILAGIVWKA